MQPTRNRPILTSPRPAAAAAILAAATGTLVLYFFPPTQYAFYPPCPIHALLGIQCPGCGATRALAALLHGHLAEALRDNALFVLLLPFALAFAAESLRRARWPEPPPQALYAILTLTTIFTIARNLI